LLAQLVASESLRLKGMLASILIGGAELLAVALSSAVCLFAHLKGRIRRCTVLCIAALAMTAGAAIAGGGLLDLLLFGGTTVPFGVDLMLAASINGFVAYQTR
jgi:hypothetical protein